MSKERRQAGRAALPRRAFGFHVQFFSPYSRSPQILCRRATEPPRQTRKLLRPSQRHRPSQTPKRVDSLQEIQILNELHKYLPVSAPAYPL